MMNKKKKIPISKKKVSLKEKPKKGKPKKKLLQKQSSGKDIWYLYMLECGDTSLYTGISNNVEKRFKTHLAGKGARYTRMHLPVTLVYIEVCGERRLAMQRELAVKSLPRLKKLALIQSHEKK
jgi:putative endonuclease